MKQLKCEMCGSTDLLKQDGMFVCQVCGTKYSVEEAKKMMIEGTVEVTGAVKIDVSDELEKLYKVARRAKEEGNSDNAIKYYEKILEKDPTSWEANFYIVYFRGKNCKIIEIPQTARDLKNCINSTLTLIKENIPNKIDQIKFVNEVAERSMEESEIYFNSSRNFYKKLSLSVKMDSHFIQSMVNECCASRDIVYTLGDSVESLFGDYNELKSTMINAWKKGVQQHSEILTSLADKEGNKNVINQYVGKVKKYDSQYSAPAQTGCYIATCVYGSYDCPEVWTLRRYRDSKLGATHGGRAFIRLYYAISPTLVKWFGNTNWFKKMWRGMLDKKVKKLQAQGYESTPYDDIDWKKK